MRKLLLTTAFLLTASTALAQVPSAQPQGQNISPAVAADHLDVLKAQLVLEQKSTKARQDQINEQINGLQTKLKSIKKTDSE